MSTKWT